MTKPRNLPTRLLAETLAIVAVAATCVVSLQQWLVPQLHGWLAGLADASALALVAAPPLYWRAMDILRRAARPHLARADGAVASADPKQRRRRALAMTTAAYVCGLAVTIAAVTYLKVRIDADAHQQFDQQVERLRAEILRRFERPVFGLNGARGVYAATPSVERAEFRAYVESRDLGSEFPGIQGFGFIERVMRDDLDAFIARERLDGAPDFTVRSKGVAPDLYVIKYIEPLRPNFQARGFDLGSDSVRREAIERAVDSGAATLSKDLVLGFGERRAPGFLVLVPIYRQGSDPATSKQRHAALVGLVYAPIFAEDLLRGVLAAADSNLHYELVHGPGGVGPMSARPPIFEARRTLSTGGRELTLRASSSTEFEDAIDRSPLGIVGIGGAALSLLLALVVWSLASGRVRAQTLAQRMTVELDRLAQVAKHTSNAVLITDRLHRITWVNEGFTRISGYDSASALGKTPTELLAADNADPGAARQVALAVAEGKACRTEFLNRARDGREYWIDMELQPLHGDTGKLIGFMEIGSDVTEKRRARAELEAALRENDALLRTIHQHAIVSVADRSGRIIDVNDAFCRISGYGRDELLGANHRMVSSGTHPSDFWVGVWRTIAGGDPWRGEVCNRAKDGALYWVDSIIAPFMDEGGRTKKYISIRTDVTARKQAEEAREAMNTDLERAKLAAEKANLAKSDFLSSMSHELRSPLNAILGFAQLMETGTPLPTPGQKESIDHILQAGWYLLELINEILDLSLIESGNVSLSLESMSLAEVLNDCHAMIEPQAKKTGIRMRFPLFGSPHHIRADRTRVKQIFVNLLSNAIKYNRAGGEVEVTYAATSTGRTRISFRDTGAGLSGDNATVVKVRVHRAGPR